LLESGIHSDGGGVNPGVDAAIFLDREARDVLDLLEVRRVGDDITRLPARVPDFMNQALQPVFIARRDDDFGAACGHSERRRASDARRGTEHDGDLLIDWFERDFSHYEAPRFARPVPVKGV